MSEQVQPTGISAEQVLGLSTNLIERTTALPSPTVEIVTRIPDISNIKPAPTVEIIWQKAAGYHGGEISM